MGNKLPLEILFLKRLREVKELKHIGIPQSGKTAVSLDKFPVRRLRDHRALVEGAVDLPLQLALAVSVRGAQAQIELARLVGLAAGQDLQIICP